MNPLDASAALPEPVRLFALAWLALSGVAATWVYINLRESLPTRLRVVLALAGLAVAAWMVQVAAGVLANYFSGLSPTPGVEVIARTGWAPTLLLAVAVVRLHRDR